MRGDKKITLREVNNFQSTDDDCINISFSTIQGLHTRLLNPQENSLTFDDFQDTKIEFEILGRILDWICEDS
jgi:type III restriction enzyme